jgi:hypothetical protein
LSERLQDFLQARYGIGFSIPYRGCVRPTSATYCLSNRQPAFSVLVSCSGLRHSRDEEPDVSRRPSSLRPDRRFSKGFVAPGLGPCMFRESEIRFDLGLWHLCRPVVSLAPPSQTIYELHTEAKARVLPPPREGCRLRNEPKCLPSVVPAGAIQLVIDPGRPPSGGSLLRVSPTNWSGLVR